MVTTDKVLIGFIITTIIMTSFPVAGMHIRQHRGMKKKTTANDTERCKNNIENKNKRKFSVDTTDAVSTGLKLGVLTTSAGLICYGGMTHSVPPLGSLGVCFCCAFCGGFIAQLIRNYGEDRQNIQRLNNGSRSEQDPK